MAPWLDTSWLPGTFLDAPAFGDGCRRIVGIGGIVWWGADTVGYPSDLLSLGGAAAIRNAIYHADPNADPESVILPSPLWAVDGFGRVVPWNGGASD